MNSDENKNIWKKIKIMWKYSSVRNAIIGIIIFPIIISLGIIKKEYILALIVIPFLLLSVSSVKDFWSNPENFKEKPHHEHTKEEMDALLHTELHFHNPFKRK